MRVILAFLAVLLVLSVVPPSLQSMSDEDFSITLINRTSRTLDLYDICDPGFYVCTPADDRFLCRAAAGRSCNYSTTQPETTLLGVKEPGASKYYKEKDLWDEKSTNITWEVR